MKQIEAEINQRMLEKSKKWNIMISEQALYKKDQSSTLNITHYLDSKYLSSH